jgi:hypothetical protein
MNLRNKILLAIFALGTIVGCDSLIYDDLKDCPQGVYVSFYSKTPCAEDSTYPVVESLKVFAFDKNGILAAEQEVQNPKLSKDYEMLIPLKEGDYTFIAWTGINAERYTVAKTEIGKTTLNEVLFEIKEVNKIANATPTPGFKIYMGTSEKVSLPAANEFGSVFEHTEINILEQTNRIQVSLVGIKNPERYDILVFSANGSMNFDGHITRNKEQLNYPGEVDATSTPKTLISKFNTLKLQTGYHNKLVVYDKHEKKNIFYADLIGSILLSKGDDHDTNIDLSCTHDFNIKLYVKDVCDCETYEFIACEVNLIKWDLHSYNIDLGDNF